MVQYLKWALPVAAMMALSACGSPASPTQSGAAEAPASEVSEVAQTTAPTVGLPLIETFMGTQKAYVESKLGPARTAFLNTHTYEIGTCEVEVLILDEVVEGFAVPLTSACSDQAMGLLKSRSLPQKLDLTMGDFIKANPDASFRADCLTLCGNAAEPWIYMESVGPRGVPSFRAASVLVTNATIDASFVMRDAIMARHGQDYVIDNKFNCNTEFDSRAREVLKDVRVDQLQVGYNPVTSC